MISDKIKQEICDDVFPTGLASPGASNFPLDVDDIFASPQRDVDSINTPSPKKLCLQSVFKTPDQPSPRRLFKSPIFRTTTVMSPSQQTYSTIELTPQQCHNPTTSEMVNPSGAINSLAAAQSTIPLMNPRPSSSVKRRLALGSSPRKGGSMARKRYRGGPVIPEAALDLLSPSPSTETSLTSLTKRFVELLQKAPDGAIDLTIATELLNVQKRRIYDITNVLEGVDLVSKANKNIVRWKGDESLKRLLCGEFFNDQVTIPEGETEIPPRETVPSEVIDQLKSENDGLTEHEKHLDHMLQLSCEQLRNIKAGEENKRLAYVTYTDIRNPAKLNFYGQTVLLVKAPVDTRLELSDPSKKLEVRMKSVNGPIDVFLCPEEYSSPNGKIWSDSDNDFDMDSSESTSSAMSSSTIESKVEATASSSSSSSSVSLVSVLSPSRHLFQHTEDHLGSPDSGRESFLCLEPNDLYYTGSSLNEMEGLHQLYDIGSPIKGISSLPSCQYNTRTTQNQ